MCFFYVLRLLLGLISLFVSMSHPLCNLPPHKYAILSVNSWSYITLPQKWEPQLLNTHPPTGAHMHILHPCLLPLITASTLPWLLLLFPWKSSTKSQWVRPFFTFKITIEILLTISLYNIFDGEKTWSLLYGVMCPGRQSMLKNYTKNERGLKK